MLNKDGMRELAYVVAVDEVIPIEGADRVECARVNGWTCMVPKGAFKAGDLGIYIEIDAKVPASNPAFAFLEKRDYKVKTQKFFKGTFISQGLLMAPVDFGWEQLQGCLTLKEGEVQPNSQYVLHTNDGNMYEEGSFLTQALGITYAEDEDNKRKASSVDKYKVMAQRRPDIFKKPFARWMMKREWGRKIMFALFGKKKDKEKAFPSHFPFVKKSDEERVENMPWILQSEEPWIRTTKVDGTSTTFILERKGKRKFEFYVCSRNVRQLDINQKCYHDDNVYWNMAIKYNIEQTLKTLLIENSNWEYVCIQGETAGPNIQGNPHKLAEQQFFAYNFIDSVSGRWNSINASFLLKKYNIPWVPIVDEEYYLPKTMEEMKASAIGLCEIKNSSGLREGYVYRSLDGKKSFKNVSNEYLLKH